MPDISERSICHCRYAAVKFDSRTQAIVARLTRSAASASATVLRAKQNRLGTFLEEGIDGCEAILAKGDRTRQRLMVIITDGQPNKCAAGGGMRQKA